MANTSRSFGAAVPLAADTALSGLSIVVNDTVADFTFNTNLPNLIHGKYSMVGWLAHIAKVLAQYIFDRCAATVAITVKPVLNNIDLSLGFPQASPKNVVPGVNTSLPRLHIGVLGGAATVNGVVSIKSLTLNNATNGWGSLFAFCEVNENRVCNAASGEVAALKLDANSRFQPRWFCCVRGHYIDKGNQEGIPGAFGDDHADGFATYYETGTRWIERYIEVSQQQRNLTGPMFKIGIFSGFGATRNILNVLPTDGVGEARLNGMTGSYLRTDQLTQGAYLRIGKSLYPIRYKSVAGNALTCYETIPATYSFPSGAPVYVISEYHAMLLEWCRSGLWHPFEPDETTGLTSWMADSYVPLRQGEWIIGHELKARVPLYSMATAGLLSTNPGFTAP